MTLSFEAAAIIIAPMIYEIRGDEILGLPFEDVMARTTSVLPFSYDLYS